MSPRPPSKPDTSSYRGRLGKAVRDRREDLKLTQAQLCERLQQHGASVQVVTLSAYELGTRPIQVDDLPAFAKALRTTIKKLVPDK